MFVDVRIAAAADQAQPQRTEHHRPRNTSYSYLGSKLLPGSLSSSALTSSLLCPGHVVSSLSAERLDNPFGRDVDAQALKGEETRRLGEQDTDW